MSTVELRRKIKKSIDNIPPKRLASLAEYVQFLNQPTMPQRLAAAQKSFNRLPSGKGVNWRSTPKPINRWHASWHVALHSSNTIPAATTTSSGSQACSRDAYATE